MTASGGGSGTGTTMTTTMDARVGLDLIVEDAEYAGKLAAALDTSTTSVKKQVFELLSALCVYNEGGRAQALRTLELHQKLKGERYRLAAVVAELERAVAVDYQTSLVAFVNCLIISAGRLADRVRVRNELVGCRLLAVLNRLRRRSNPPTGEPSSATSSPGPSADLQVQLDVFEEQRESDEAQSPHGLDLSSHQDVFYAILRRVADTPQEVPFLSILQHLLRVDPREPVSDVVWDTAERLVHRATLLEGHEEAARLLRAPSVKHLQMQSNGCCACGGGGAASGNGGPRKPSLTLAANVPAPPPPPPPPSSDGARPPPPPPPGGPSLTHPSVSKDAPAPHVRHAATRHPTSGVPSGSTAAGAASSNGAAAIASTDGEGGLLPQQATPTPKMKMKTINWNKIPSNRVVGGPNIWSMVAATHQHSPMADLDWSEMEGLFCQSAPPASLSVASAQGSPRLGGGPRTRDHGGSQEVTLLDGKRSLNVNIFLKQFRSSNEDIVRLIRDGDHEDIGAEKLRGLLKILPEVDELDMLKAYDGDFERLGNAEKFLLQLSSLSNYKLRIESMLLKEEFATNTGYLEPSIAAMMNAADGLMTNKPLQEVLYMVVVAGNFLNSGGYAGNAAGVKLSSLQKLTDIRANKPNMNLIHFVATQAEKRGRHLLSFADDLTVLEEASKTSVEQLQNETNALEARVRRVGRQIELPSTEVEVKEQMVEFLSEASRGVATLQRAMADLEAVRRRLADFFCEDAGTFKLDECFKVFHGFCVKFRQAVAENARRRLQEEQAGARRRQREEMFATKRRQMSGSLAGTPVSDAEGNFPDLSFFTTGNKKRLQNGTSMTSEDELSVLGSPSLSRRRLGSFNGQNGAGAGAAGETDRCSPDVTPNGSLRRRRSRVLSEDDEGNLMEFLRASSVHDAGRERKSWGSLDRSWARRARGSGPRKRPALLGADLGQERERPSSPSPLAEEPTTINTEATGEEQRDTTTTSTTSAPRPREWRQKIESWLQANETPTKVRTNNNTTTATNRRSFEMEVEGGSGTGALGTLPEGRPVPAYRRVYADWQPTAAIDKTDVLGTMEAIQADAQPHVKDKSAWRKSTLNVPNSSEETNVNQNKSARHGSSTTQSGGDDASADLEARRNLIVSLGERPPTDRLTLYLRRPTSGRTTSAVTSPGGGGNAAAADVDADNVETPPATRRVFGATPPAPPAQCRRLLGRSSSHSHRELPPSPEEPEPPVAGEHGHFDRFSAARRTRRYRRSDPDAVTIATPAVTPVTAETQVVSAPQQMIASSSSAESTAPIVPTHDKETRLRQWQDKLKAEAETAGASAPTAVTSVTSTAAARRRPATTGVDRDEVRSAHDNDEGFEETQSLMSESASQGASSLDGCTPLPPPPAHQVASSRPVTTPVTKPTLPAGGSMRRGSGLPRRTTPPQQQPPPPVPVGRASSRASLLSSRSSLNSLKSGTSTSTVVRRAPSAARPTLRRQPTPQPAVPTRRMPASTTPSRPPHSRPSTTAAFMRPTTASATKIHHGPPSGTTAVSRIAPFRSTQVK